MSCDTIKYQPGDKSMQPLFRGRPKSYPSRTEKVCAIQKAVQKGTYQIDTPNVANALLIHLLTHSIAKIVDYASLNFPPWSEGFLPFPPVP
jgi:hypothetical protein